MPVIIDPTRWGAYQLVYSPGTEEDYFTCKECGVGQRGLRPREGGRKFSIDFDHGEECSIPEQPTEVIYHFGERGLQTARCDTNPFLPLSVLKKLEASGKKFP